MVTHNSTITRVFRPAGRIPCRYESLITYYGVYSSSHRGKCKRENREEQIEEVVVEAVSVTPGMSRHSSWAKWILKIYETDRLTCSECGEPMRIIAFIIDPLEVAKILEHIGEQTSRAPIFKGGTETCALCGPL